jgi:hypothetical protein
MFFKASSSPFQLSWFVHPSQPAESRAGARAVSQILRSIVSTEVVRCCLRRTFGMCSSTRVERVSYTEVWRSRPSKLQIWIRRDVWECRCTVASIWFDLVPANSFEFGKLLEFPLMHASYCSPTQERHGKFSGIPDCRLGAGSRYSTIWYWQVSVQDGDPTWRVVVRYITVVAYL